MKTVFGSAVSIHGSRVLVTNEQGRPPRMIVDGEVIAPLLNLDIGAEGNAATTSADTLLSYDIPANYLDKANRGIYIRAFGAFGGNAQEKRATLSVGGVDITTGTDTGSGSVFELEAWLVSTGTDTQRVVTKGQLAGALIDLASDTDTSDDGAAIAVALTGTSGSGSASDIVGQGLQVEFMG